MLEDRHIRQLLVAERLLALGLAPAAQVAAALRSGAASHQREDGGVLEHLCRATGRPPQEFQRAVDEAERLIQAADGDVRRAFAQQGGVPRSLHAAAAPAGPAALGPVDPASGMASGAVLAPHGGRYTDFLVAGEGGMGVVYMALDAQLSRFVALKMVRPDTGGPAGGGPPSTPWEAGVPPPGSTAAAVFEELRERFLQEAWITAGLEHPGVVPIHELGATPEGVPYYTMRFIRGQRSLREEVEAVRSQPVEARLRLLEPFLKVCDTLRYAHSHGVVHRDLKPDNIALGEFGEVLVLDWGLAKLDGRGESSPGPWWQRVREHRERVDLRTEAAALGTPGYMSPEAAAGHLGDVDARSDVYSLGAMLYEILTGRLPHAATRYAEYLDLLQRTDPPSAQRVAPDVPAPLSDLCAAALSRDRALRPPSVDVLAQQIRSWQLESARERELAMLRREAQAALDAAADLAGPGRLQVLDRAVAACHQLRARRPDDPSLAGLDARTQALRERGILDRERSARRRALLRLGAVLLILLTLAGVIVAGVLDERRRAAERSEARAVASAEEAAQARMLAEASAVRSALAGARAALGSGDTASAARLLEELPPEGRGWIARALASQVDASVRRWQAHDGRILGLAAGVQGRLLATVDVQGHVRAWDPDSGRLLAETEGADPAKQALACWDHGRIAFVSREGRVVIWSPESGARLELAHPYLETEAASALSESELAELRRRSDIVQLLPIGDGPVAVGVTRSGAMFMLGSQTAVLSPFGGPIGDPTVFCGAVIEPPTPRGFRMLLGCVDGTLRDFFTGEVDSLPWLTLPEHGSLITACMGSREGPIAWADVLGRVTVSSPAAGGTWSQSVHRGTVYRLLLDSQRRLWSCSYDGSVACTRLDGQPLARLLGHRGHVTGLCRTSGARERLFSADSTGMICEWDPTRLLQPGVDLRIALDVPTQIAGRGVQPSLPALGDDGCLLLEQRTADSGSRWVLMDPRERRIVDSWTREDGPPLLSLQGGVLFAGRDARPGVVRLDQSGPSRGRRRIFEGEPGRLVQVSSWRGVVLMLSQEGELTAVLEDGQVTRRTLPEWAAPGKMDGALYVAPDGDALAVRLLRGGATAPVEVLPSRVLLLRFPSLELVRQLELPAPVTAVGWTAYGPWLGVAAGDRSVRFYDKGGLEVGAPWTPDPGQLVFSVAGHPSEPFVLIGYEDGTIAAHDLPSRRFLATLGVLGGAVYISRFSSDGRFFSAATTRGDIAYWDGGTAGWTRSLR